MKHTVVSEAGNANVNHLCEADANVNHLCEADANVKPWCNNDMSDHVSSSSLHVTAGKDLYQASLKEALGVSDLTTKARSPQAESIDTDTQDVMLDHQAICTAKVVSSPGVEGKCPDTTVRSSVFLNNVNPNKGKVKNKSDTKDDFRLIYDINYTDVEDKFVNSILHANQFKLSENSDKVDTEIYNTQCHQSDFNFVN